MKLVKAGLILIAVSSLANHPTGNVAPATGVMASLRQEHDRIRSANSTRPVGLSTTPDVSSLVGKRRSDILVGLGEPDACPAHDHGGCAAVGEWLYLFYKLPAGWRGGGPELHLNFDAAQRCLRAEWVFTQ